MLNFKSKCIHVVITNKLYLMLNSNNLPTIRAYLPPGRKWNIGVKWYLNVRKRRNKVFKLK
jgi:hypothetical protein